MRKEHGGRPKWVWLMRALAIAGAVVLIMIPTRRPLSRVEKPSPREHVILVGASIGRAWHLEGWPDRAAAPEFSAEAVAAWQFDKSAVLREVLMRPKRAFHFNRTYLASLFQPPPKRPGIVILKECSSYFPGDLDAYLRKLSGWADQVRAHRAVVVLATVVPVTRARSSHDPGKQSSLLEYNRRVRLLAQQQGIALLDLASAVSEEGEGSFLRDEFTSGDGSHLNANAYSHLDRALRTTLCAVASSSHGR